MKNDTILQYAQKLQDKVDEMKNLYKNDPCIVCELYDLKLIALKLELERKLELSEEEFRQLREKDAKKLEELCNNNSNNKGLFKTSIFSLKKF
jgi:hypothetical protein